MDTQEFWKLVWGRLDAEERSMAWLARRIGLTRQALHNYSIGTRQTPPEVKARVAEYLDIRLDEVEVAA